MYELRRTLSWCALGTLAVALITAVAFRLHFSFATVSFCFLLFLVAQSLSGDFASSAIVSVLAVASLDYFFVEPLFTFEVNSPLDTLGLASFLITGLVITKLVTKLKHQSELLRLHHERLRRLYDLAQKLLALEPNSEGASHFLEPFCGIFGIRAVCLIDAVSADVYAAGQADAALEQKTHAALLQGEQNSNRDNGIAARCIHAGGRTIGAIGFEGLEDPGLTVGPLAALAAAHLERTHSFLRASSAAAAAQTESHRTAILDALAHEFKTPLATILTAAGALQEVQSGGSEHGNELAEIIESEAARLGALTSKLIRTARLEREEVRPWIELIDVSSLLVAIAKQHATRSSDQRICVIKECEKSEVMADPELLRLAVSQLLDNACKYSIPSTTVGIRISRENDRVAIRVISSGHPIPPTDRSKVFDRYYRGGDSVRAGTGMGLFVARKIAIALGGELDLEDDPAGLQNTVFRLALPIPDDEGES